MLKDIHMLKDNLHTCLDLLLLQADVWASVYTVLYTQTFHRKEVSLTLRINISRKEEEKNSIEEFRSCLNYSRTYVFRCFQEPPPQQLSEQKQKIHNV